MAEGLRAHVRINTLRVMLCLAKCVQSILWLKDALYISGESCASCASLPKFANNSSHVFASSLCFLSLQTVISSVAMDLAGDFSGSPSGPSAAEWWISSRHLLGPAEIVVLQESRTARIISKPSTPSKPYGSEPAFSPALNAGFKAEPVSQDGRLFELNKKLDIA